MYPIAFNRHDTFNKIFCFVFWVDKNDDIIAFWICPFKENGIERIRETQTIGKLTHQNMVPDLQRREHRAGWNLEGLDDKASNKQGKKQSDQQRFGIFAKYGFLFLLGCRCRRRTRIRPLDRHTHRPLD